MLLGQKVGKQRTDYCNPCTWCSEGIISLTHRNWNSDSYMYSQFAIVLIIHLMVKRLFSHENIRIQVLCWSGPALMNVLSIIWYVLPCYYCTPFIVEGFEQWTMWSLFTVGWLLAVLWTQYVATFILSLYLFLIIRKIIYYTCWSTYTHTSICFAIFYMQLKPEWEIIFSRAGWRDYIYNIETHAKLFMYLKTTIQKWIQHSKYRVISHYIRTLIYQYFYYVGDSPTYHCHCLCRETSIVAFHLWVLFALNALIQPARRLHLLVKMCFQLIISK